jgi:alpha-glucosidase
VDRAVELFEDSQPAPCWDQPEVHEVYRAWRAIADSYYPPRAFCGEVWVTTPQRQANYVRSDELHTVFNFDFLKAPWDADGIRTIVEQSLHANGLVGAPTTWVLSNHDVPRHASRFSTNPAKALLRARALTTFMLGLPGPAYLYQGEELGLPEVFDIPDEYRADPIFFRTAGAQMGRDGCRVPLPWSADEPSFGFGPSDESWLPQPPEWAEYARDRAAADESSSLAPHSTLALYRRLLSIRRAEPALGIGEFETVAGMLNWVDFDIGTPPGRVGPRGVIGFDRTGGSGVRVVLNTGTQDVTMAGSWRLLVASGGSHRAVTVGDDAVVLPPDCAVWLTPG